MFDDDPRLTGEHVRRIAAREDRCPVTLVGAVHDHPASAYRARRVVEASDPDALALELPPLAVPLFEKHAATEGALPRSGCEFAAAIRTAATDRVVGIDGPSAAFVRRFAGRLARDRPPARTVRSAVRSLWSVSKHAVSCRIGAAVAGLTDLAVGVKNPVEHGCTRADDPAVQADDERTQVRRAMTVANALGGDAAGGLRQATREAHMAARLRDLRQDGSVTAVVGIAHLDAVAEAIGDR